MNEALEPYFSSLPNWTFHNPVNLNVGRGCRVALLEKLAGRSVLVVTTERGRRQISDDEFLANLASRCNLAWVDKITENPGLTDLQAEIDQLQDGEFDAVLAFGGGSAMDAAKALRIALAGECQGHSLKTLLEQPELHRNAKTAPLYTVPTTAGTGSEVTPFATLWHHEIKKKLSLSGPSVFPTEAYVDSALTDSVPVEVTISTGLDAINQAAESIWNKNANSITLAYATRALRLGFSALPLLAAGEGGEQERDKMSEASLLAGLAISHTRTALCHSMSYPITAHFGVPHGLACAFTMPAVLRLNLQAEDGRFAELAFALTGTASLDALAQRFDDLHEALQVRRRVKNYVADVKDLLALKEEMFTPGRADNNLSNAINLDDILDASWSE